MPSVFSDRPGPRIAIVAGELSGDLLGAGLIKAIRAQIPHAQFCGIAGPKMQAAGAKSLFPIERLAIRGYIEVLRHLPALFGIRRKLKQIFLHEKPDVFIGIDAPDFNLGLARSLKAHGIKTIQYVSPTIWAWRAERIHKIKAATTEVLCLYPFEPALYHAVDSKATYVGHPLADEMPITFNRDEVRETIGILPNQLVFTLLPGSRISEVENHVELYINTARLLFQRYPKALFLVPLVSREAHVLFETARYKLQALDIPLRLMFGHSQEAMQVADVILVASGTATLESMLAKQPMVVTYKLNPTTYRMVKKRMLLPYVSQPNILANRFVVPELLQDEATPENLAQVLSNYVDNKILSIALADFFTKQHETLRQGASQRAAEAVIAYLPPELPSEPASDLATLVIPSAPTQTDAPSDIPTRPARPKRTAKKTAPEMLISDK